MLIAGTAFAEPTSVTFGVKPARVGDSVDQGIRLQVRLKAMVRRGAEVLDESESNVTRAHKRRVTTTDVQKGRRVAATVAYGEATEEKVAGKTYQCRRDGEKLVITDTNGAIPSMGEYEVVARHMQMLGKANPLAEFMRGRTVTVGQSLDVPNSVAAALFGKKAFGDVERFRLKLVSVQGTPVGTAARFDADVSVAATDGTQTRMELSGPMVIDAMTSRILSTELLGPVAMHQVRHDPGGSVQVSATGRFTVSLEAAFTDARVATRNGVLRR